MYTVYRSTSTVLNAEHSVEEHRASRVTLSSLRIALPSTQAKAKQQVAPRINTHENSVIILSMVCCAVVNLYLQLSLTGLDAETAGLAVLMLCCLCMQIMTAVTNHYSKPRDMSLTNVPFNVALTEASSADKTTSFSPFGSCAVCS